MEVENVTDLVLVLFVSVTLEMEQNDMKRTSKELLVAVQKQILATPAEHIKVRFQQQSLSALALKIKSLKPLKA